MNLFTKFVTTSAEVVEFASKQNYDMYLEFNNTNWEGHQLTVVEIDPTMKSIQFAPSVSRADVMKSLDEYSTYLIEVFNDEVLTDIDPILRPIAMGSSIGECMDMVKELGYELNWCRQTCDDEGNMGVMYDLCNNWLEVKITAYTNGKVVFSNNVNICDKIGVYVATFTYDPKKSVYPKVTIA